MTESLVFERSLHEAERERDEALAEAGRLRALLGEEPVQIEDARIITENDKTQILSNTLARLSRMDAERRAAGDEEPIIEDIWPCPGCGKLRCECEPTPSDDEIEIARREYIFRLPVAVRGRCVSCAHLRIDETGWCAKLDIDIANTKQSTCPLYQEYSFISEPTPSDDEARARTIAEQMAYGVVGPTIQSYTLALLDYAADVRAETEKRVREECARCRDAMPILPGPMPDEMWESIRHDRDAMTNALRIAIRQALSEYEAAIRAGGEVNSENRN